MRHTTTLVATDVRANVHKAIICRRNINYHLTSLQIFCGILTAQEPQRTMVISGFAIVLLAVPVAQALVREGGVVSISVGSGWSDPED